MSSTIDTINNYPEVSFIEDMTLEQMMGEMVQDFQDKYKEVTGQTMKLGKSDPNKLQIYAAALQIFQGFTYIDSGAKKNLLKYTYEDFLDELCSLKGIQRQQGSVAYTTLKFTLSAAQNTVITIPMGTRVTDSNGNYFFTETIADIPIGDTTIEIPAQCTEVGEASNDIEVGELNVLVDLIPYVASVSNTTKTQGGSDIESDDSLKERFFLAPSSYSVAGPDDAYVYWVKSFSASIQDVKVSSPTPCVVDIRFIMTGGTLPGTSMAQQVSDYLQEKKVRPMTDQVQVSAPDVETYNVNMTYYINESDKAREGTIKAAVQQAITNYIDWQSGVIGRDIDPGTLIQYVKAAGAKRVVVTYPVYTPITKTTVAQKGTETVTYGGLEDD